MYRNGCKLCNASFSLAKFSINLTLASGKAMTSLYIHINEEIFVATLSTKVKASI